MRSLKDEKIFVAGHRGMVGSAIVRHLREAGCETILQRNRSELDLLNQAAVEDFFAQQQPTCVVLAAAKVGGIIANNTLRAEFIYQNMMIQSNVINAAYANGVRRLMFLGSSCIYPRDAPQPIGEEQLLTGPLELTNRPYAVAKISGIEMCWSYNLQYGTRYLAVMPSNLYGLGDNYHPENSHVIPGLIRRAHDSRISGVSEMAVWGSGKPRREFLFADDMAEACVSLLSMEETQIAPLFSATAPPLINIGTGEDHSIAEIARLICSVVGFEGRLRFDASRPDGTLLKRMDCKKINALGWTPKTSLREGLNLSYEDFLSRHGSKQ